MKNSPVPSSNISKVNSRVPDLLSRVEWPVVGLEPDLHIRYVNPAAKEYFEGQLHGSGAVFLSHFESAEKETLDNICKSLIQKKQSRQSAFYNGAIQCWFDAEVFTDHEGLTLLLKPLKIRPKTENTSPVDRNAIILKNMGETFLLIDENLQVIDTNPAFCENLGYSREEVLKMNVCDFDAILTREQILSYLSDADAVPSMIIDTQNRTKSGELVDTEVSVFSIIMSGKKYFVALGRDITAYKKAQDELKETNERLRLISNSTEDAIWEHNLKTDERWSSEIHQKLYGTDYAKNSLTLEDWEKHILSDRKKEISASYLAAIDGKDKSWTAEYWFQGADGKSFYVYDRAYFSYDKSNNLRRIIGSMLDITELKNIQEQLTSQKNLSESIINALPGIFFLINKENRLVRWNKNLKTVTGYSAEEISKMGPTEFFEGSYPNLLDKKLNEVLTNGSAETEGFLITKNGQKIPYFFNGLKTEVQGEEMIIGTGKDMTETKKAESSLRAMEQEIMNQKIQEQKKISRAIISAQERERHYIGRELHDNVNQLLAGTRLYLTMAGKKSSDIKKSIEYPLELLDNTIGEIRSLTHRYISPLKEVDLKQQTKNLIQLLEAAPIKVNFKYGLENIDIAENLRLNIYRILQEQVNNILKYAKAKNARVSLKFKDCAIHMQTTDDGIGFDPSGMWEGIGLSNMANRVEAYNGKIEILSTPGKGCTINIQIPVLGCTGN